MSRTRFFVQFWLPVLAWMTVIFSASSDHASFEHSSRIIGPLLHWVFPHITEPTVDSVVFVVRKLAHLTEYAVLALLVWRLLANRGPHSVPAWSWSDFRLTVLIVFLYAASDEFHQRFVPSREASVWDVLLDTAGGLLALILVWLLGRWRRRC